MRVLTKYGEIEGVSERGCVIYKGVPYAKAPVGELRFKRPLDPESWQGVYKADHFRARSMQGPERGGFYYKEFYSNPDFSTPQSEDCLYLNIWTPKETSSDAKLPVAVYVHGGAFLGGAGSNLPFVCDKLVERGVIVVTINYRLGALGFLYHPLLTESGNLGLRDQIQAFKWVKENISSFGGDPDRITAFGQSAGAMSLQALALSGRLEGLVNGMILQSGGGYRNPLGELRSRELAEEIGEIFFEELGIDTSKCLADDDYKAESMKKLLEIDETELMDKVGAVIGKCFAQKKGMPFVPILDGELLSDSLDKLTDNGSFLKIPYILGSNGDDITTEGNEDKRPDNNPMHIANMDYAKRVIDAGQKAYVYYFDRKMPGDDAGSFHSAELWYVFGSLEYCWRPLEKRDFELSKAMVTYWTNFFKTGDPNEPYETERWDGCAGGNSDFRLFE